MKHITTKTTLLFALLFLFATQCFAQTDSLKNDLKFDFGITRNKNLNLWPIFKITQNDELSDIQLLFTIFQKKRNKQKQTKHSHLLPFYFNDSSTYNRDLRILSLYYPTLFHYQRNYQSDFNSYKILELAPKISLFGFAKTKDGLLIENNLLFFLWYKNNSIEQKSYLVLFPIYWSFTSPEKYSRTLFPFFSYGSFDNRQENYRIITPLYWNFRNDQQKTNILFPIWYNQQKTFGEFETKRNILFPIYWSYKTPYFENLTFFPLFSYGKSNDNQKKYLTITPLFWQHKNGNTKRSFLLPIFYNSQKDTGIYKQTRNIVFPLYWSYKNMDKNTKILLPLVYSFNTQHYKSFTFAPLFSIGKSTDNNKNYFMLTPLIGHFQNSKKTSNFVFPIWFYKKDETEKTPKISNTILPIVFYRKDSLKTTKIVAPFLWDFKKPSFESFTFVPFFSTGTNLADSSVYQAITPLFWNYKSRNKKITCFLPFYYKQNSTINENKISKNILAPFYWSYEDNYRNNKIVFPLIWSIKYPAYETFAFVPIFAYGHSTDSLRNFYAISPIFWHIKNNEKTSNILFPLWYSSRRDSGSNQFVFRTLFPVFWQYKNNYAKYSVIVPFVWQINKPSYKSVTFMPFFSYGHNDSYSKKHLAITPLFWHRQKYDKTSNMLFPVWYNRTKIIGNDEYKSNVIFPIYWSYKTPEKNNKTVFPIIWSRKNMFYQSFTLFPIVSAGHSKDSTHSHFSFTPFYWHFENKTTTRNYFIPLWYQKKYNSEGAKYEKNTIFPIYWSYKDSISTKKIFFPITWQFKNKNYSHFTFAPFFSTQKNTDNTRGYFAITPLFWHFKEGKDNSNLFLPLWFNYKEVQKDGVYKFKTFFPIYWAKSTPTTNKNVIFPIVWQKKTPDYNSFTFFPLMSFGSTPDKQISHKVITPLYWNFNTEKKRTNILFPLFYSKRDFANNNQTKKTFIFPLYWSHKDSSKSNKILFPLIWSLQNPKYKSFTFFPITSFGLSTDGNKKHFMLTPLFWNFKTETKSSNGFFPFYNYKSYKNGDSRFNLGLFLFRYKSENNTASSDFMWPLCRYKKDSSATSFRFAPFVWYKNTSELKYFSIQPFFYKQKTPEKNSFYLMWLLYSHQNIFGLKKSNNFLWKALYWDKYDNNDFEFRFMYLMLANVKKDGDIERSFFPFYHYKNQSNGERSLSLFFHFYNTSKQKLNSSDEFYLEERIFWFIRLRSNYKKLLAEGKISPRRRDRQKQK